MDIKTRIFIHVLIIFRQSFITGDVIRFIQACKSEDWRDDWL